MRISESYYGDFIVYDELPFDIVSLLNASHQIEAILGYYPATYPITIDYNEKTGFWEAWFTRPVSDDVYIEKMTALQKENEE